MLSIAAEANGGVAAEVIGAVGLVIVAGLGLLGELIRRGTKEARVAADTARHTAADAASTAADAANRIGKVNGEGNVIQMLERVLDSNQRILAGQVGQDNRIASLEGDHRPGRRHRTTAVRQRQGRHLPDGARDVEPRVPARVREGGPRAGTRRGSPPRRPPI